MRRGGRLREAPDLIRSPRSEVSLRDMTGSDPDLVGTARSRPPGSARTIGHVRRRPSTIASSVLRNLDPLLTPELLHVLAAMGHGDEIVVCDANFPAESVALRTAHGSVVRLAGADAPAAVRAILSLLPLDDFVETAAFRMEVVGAPDEIPEVQREVQAEVAAAGESRPLGSIERFAFYEAAKHAYAIVATGERRFYGCFVFKKGVIAPD